MFCLSFFVGHLIEVGASCGYRNFSELASRISILLGCKVDKGKLAL